MKRLALLAFAALLAGFASAATVTVNGSLLRAGSVVLQTTAATDTTPDAFTFTDQTGVAVSTTITSAAITVTGINATSAISVSGGTYDVNSSGSFTSSGGSVNNNDTVRARHTSSASNSTAVNTVVTIGGVSDTFTSTTVSSGLPLLFSDNFESGGLTTTQNGVAWAASNNSSVSTLIANGGTRSLRFNFAGSANTFTGTIAEERIDLGATYSEMQFEYDLYIPSGSEGIGSAAYAHRNNTAAPDNNKFIRIWRGNKSDGNDGYSTFYSKWGGSFDRPTGTGISQVYGEYGKNASGMGQNGESGSGPNSGKADPYVTSSDLGTWIAVKVYVKSATSANNDGILQIYKNGSLVASNTNLPQYPSGGAGQNGFDYAYLLGAAQSGFDSTTYLFVDNIKIYGQ